MTSLELLWTFAEPDLFRSETMKSTWDSAQLFSSMPKAEQQQQETAFHRVCHIVPATFPNVRHLYIALQAYIVPPHQFRTEDLLGDVERVIFGPTEDIFRALGPGPGKEFSFAIQHGGWQVFAKRLTQGEKKNTRVRRYFDAVGETGYQEKLWKPLGDGEEAEGYWLRPGWDDFELFGAEYWLLDIWKTGDFRGEF